VRSTGGEKYRFKKINIATFASGRYLFPKLHVATVKKTEWTSEQRIWGKIQTIDLSSSEHAIKFLCSRKRTSWIMCNDYVSGCISHRLANTLGFTTTLISYSRTYFCRLSAPFCNCEGQNIRIKSMACTLHARWNLQNFMYRFMSCAYNSINEHVKISRLMRDLLINDDVCG